MGLIAVIFLLVLSVTGIMLNHTESLNMDKTSIESDLILNWYELNPKGKAVSYKSGDNIISQWDGQLFFNQTALSFNKAKLIGAVKLNEIIAIAFDKNILLLNLDGEIIEHFNMPIKFSSLIKIGLHNKNLLVKTKNNKHYIADENILNWAPSSKTNNSWSESVQLNQIQKNALKKSFRGNGLSLERVILDLHSGRIFNGNWGVYIMDISAFIIILLSLSGFWIWWSRQQKMQSKRHLKKRKNK